jgi:D-alanyl-D-alanine carboxypeptidase/D-alanyl-D-alanine-endopeptidase (penicillin-binding protein 4)
MRVVVLLIAVTCTSWFWDDGQVLARSICVSRLAQEVNQIRQQALVPTTRLGVYAQTVTEPPLTLIDRDGGSAFIPASNQKILTSAVGLSVLGGNYRIATSLMTELPVQGGEVQGNLWVIGRGDPTLTSDGGLKHLVRQLRLKGIRKIHGSIHLLNKLPSTPLGQGWEPQDLHEYYAAPASGFTLDENSHYWTVTPTRRGQPVQFRWDFPHLVQGWRVENQAITSPPNGSYTLTTSRPTEKVIRITGTMPENSAPELGGVAIPDPEAYFRERLLAELQAQGIEILHLDSVGKSPEPSVLLAQHLSPPLTEILATINKDSNNLHAEQLLRILATTVNPVPPDTYTVGMGIIRQFLVDRGIDTTGLVIADGSGLSRYNLVTPKMVVAVLQIMAKNSLFRNSLAIAGRDGTLKRRFLRTILADNLRAKTGTITSASALSGYVRSQGLGEIVFSIMINHTNQSTPSMRRVIDRITLLLAHLQRC